MKKLSVVLGLVILPFVANADDIDLEGKDLSHIIGGFCFAASKDDNPNGFVVYFDDIIYE